MKYVYAPNFYAVIWMLGMLIAFPICIFLSIVSLGFFHPWVIAGEIGDRIIDAELNAKYKRLGHY